MASRASRRVLYAALLGNILVAVTKFHGEQPHRQLAVVADIEDRVKKVHPEVVLLLIKPQSAAALERVRARRSGGA